ncbi:MAG: c-type cytochrome biogenesis protein CcmI [Rhodospirillaceae bacterium]|nr:c-type cytochrome biogenesis protein CcmI [Rhodospirillaceae bacterium]
MTALVVAMAVLAALVGLALAGPLLRRNAASAARAAYDLTVFRDQLKEIERDAAEGLLDAEGAEAARLEVQRRMLAADAELQAGSGRAAGEAPRRLTAALIGAGVPLAAAALYVVLGSPDQPDQPFATREVPAAQSAPQTAGGPVDPGPEMTAMLSRLMERLKNNPGDIEGWLLLGHSYMALERFPDALKVFARAREIADGRTDVEIAYAEALVLTSRMKVTDDAAAIFRAVRDKAPFDPKARYYLGLQKAQAGDVSGALQDWADLVAVSSEDAPWVPVVRQQIARAAEELKIDPLTITMSENARKLIATQPPVLRPSTPIMPPEGADDPHAGHPHAAAEDAPGAQPGPSREQMEAAQDMTAEDRDAMIRGMVQRLADRLKETPDDLAGWQRLEKAYRVLGETAKADAAAAEIKRLTP